MNAEQLALARGMADTRDALRRWRSRPLPVLGAWVAGALGTALVLLLATYVVSRLARPDLSGVALVGVHTEATLGDYGFILFRNGLVLALHALACVAGFMAGSSLPVVADSRSGLSRRVHDAAGPIAIGFVVCATLFSLGTQAFVLGSDTATIANQLGISQAKLLAVLSLHAIPELTALFLPLAAWTLASRRRRWQDLLAATVATVSIAVPVLLVTAAIETWVTPGVLAAVAG